MQACKTCKEEGLLSEPCRPGLRIPTQPRPCFLDTPQAQPICTFNHAQPRDIIASLTLSLLKQARSLQGIRTRRNPNTKFASRRHAESRRASRPPTNRHSLTDYRTSLTRLCSYTAGIRRAGKLRLLLSCAASPVCLLTPLPALRATTPMILPARQILPRPQTEDETSRATVPDYTLSPSVKCKSKLSTISATWRLPDAVA